MSVRPEILKAYHAQFEYHNVDEDWLVVKGFKDTWGTIQLYSWEHAWIYTDDEMMATAGFDTTQWQIGKDTYFEPPLRLKVQTNHHHGVRVVAILTQAQF